MTKDLKVGAIIDVNLGEDVCEEVKEGKYKPEYGEMYYYVRLQVGGYEISLEAWVDDLMDWHRYNDGNCFQTETEEEAEQHKLHLEAKMELMKLREELQGSWEPDWGGESESEKKHYWCWNHIMARLSRGWTYQDQCLGVLYFENEQVMNEIREKMGDERLKLALNIKA